MMQSHEERAFKDEVLSVLRTGVDDLFESEHVLLEMPIANQVDGIVFASSKETFDHILMAIRVPYRDSNWKP